MTTHQSLGRVVVGWDGRWQSGGLLFVAAQEATALGRPLSVVTLIHAPEEVLSLQTRPADGWHPQQAVGHALHEGETLLATHYPDLRIATQWTWFNDVTDHTEPFASAVLLVVGDRDVHGNAAFTIGSASRRLVQATHCPVLRVPISHLGKETQRSLHDPAKDLAELPERAGRPITVTDPVAEPLRDRLSEDLQNARASRYWPRTSRCCSFSAPSASKQDGPVTG